MPDQCGRVVLVTGATSGIGMEVARALACSGAEVIVSGRDPARVAAAAGELRSAPAGSGPTPAGVHELVMDVSSMASVRAGATTVLETWDRLDVLVNNAGVILTGRQESVDGHEMTLATNHLGHFLLTRLLLDRLRASAPARVVNVASTAHRGARSMGFEDLHARRSYNAVTAYNRSKLANVLFTRELARRVEGSGVSAFAVHPGAVRSGWGQSGDTRGLLNLVLKMGRPFEISPAAGATAVLHAATAPGLETMNGAYLQMALGGNYGPVRAARPSAAARDDAAAAELWQVSEALVG